MTDYTKVSDKEVGHQIIEIKEEIEARRKYLLDEIEKIDKKLLVFKETK